MAKIANPVLFSTYFKVSPTAFRTAGLIDPFIDVDTQLFIDPLLIHKSTNEVIKNEGVAAFADHFSSLVRLLVISKKKNDAAWKAAFRQLNLDEPASNGLGYGGAGTSGSKRPDALRNSILDTCSEIIELGSEDPEMISLMSFFEEGVGADTVSDLVTHAIIEPLSQITEQFCLQYKVPIEENDVSSRHKLPKITKANGKENYLVLVPEDVVRELPYASDWSEVSEVAFQNQTIKNKLSKLLGNIVKATIVEKKNALKNAVLSDADTFQEFLAEIKGSASGYDPNLDLFSYYKLKALLAEGMSDIPQGTKYDLQTSLDGCEKVVLDSINHFKHHVENGNLWEELWVSGGKQDGKPKKERSAQLIFFAIADLFCKLNNLDISPETNMGGGPVDFKFSKGYATKIVVEMKKSDGRVKHGYEKQLEFYKSAAKTESAIYVIIDVGNMGNKLNEIKKIRQARKDAGENVSEIIVIDATPKKSASKRE
ncbi:hypothetical protein [Hirschia maritima]|uniref:hypothetical protein n=1 Tax=Hirschia maritima TaxID=1121961 RepID=UPI0003684E37|nr:hypothetical protein [Hirschia maritima]